jgi:elongation factor 2
MESADQIRNISVIAHVDHGKSTLSDSLVAAAGIIKQEEAGEKRSLGIRADEQARGITIKSTAISMMYHIREDVVADLEATKRHFLVNLIDSPGHVDFSSEVTAALRVTDGALVVVDCVEGCCVQTETVLRQALSERIKPVLFVNKVDRMMLELKVPPEEAYQAFCTTIQDIDVVIATYADAAMGELQVEPARGSVGWGSGYQGWAFTLPQMARVYAARFGCSAARLVERLWGDNYYDPTSKKWTKEARAASGEELPRAFCQFCLEPIYQIVHATMSDDRAKLESILSRLQITLSSDEHDLVPKKRLKAVMMKFLPAADALLQMIVGHLPSPRQAQAYRAELLYSGDSGDAHCAGIRACDPRAGLILYVSKMVPTADKTRFVAFGRVFSGTVRTGAKVRIMGSNYVHGQKVDLHEDKAFQRCVLMMGRTQETVEDVPCGNVVGLVGVDKFIVKTATICDADQTPHPLRDMKYSVSPVVRVAVDTKNPADLPKLVEGLKRLAKSDPLVVCTTTESGEHIVAGAGELHLEICLKDLADDFMNGAQLKISEPVVSFRETVTERSSVQCLVKTTNKHNRLYCRGAPLGEEASLEMETGSAGADADPKERARYLADKHDWDVAEARRIWCFGPDGRGPNVVVDTTKGVQGLGDVQDSVVAAWQWATSEGPLCGEQLRGVRVDLEDAMLHSDPAHRNGRQIIPAARRAFQACELSAGARLLEPVFRVDVQTVASCIGGVYSVLTRRRGTIIGEENRVGTPVYCLRAYLPVSESFGFSADLRASTGGQAFPQCAFDHWELLPGDPTVPKSLAAEVVAKIRQRKGLRAELPCAEDLVDKL